MDSDAISQAKAARQVPIIEDGHRFRWRDLVPAGVLLCVGLVGLVIATLSPSGRDGQYAVVAPPWYDLPQTIALIRAADGGIVDAGGPNNVVIVHSVDPAFVDAAYRAGAWAVIDPMQLRGCVGFKPASLPAQGE